MSNKLKMANIIFLSKSKTQYGPARNLIFLNSGLVSLKCKAHKFSCWTKCLLMLNLKFIGALFGEHDQIICASNQLLLRLPKFCEL